MPIPSIPAAYRSPDAMGFLPAAASAGLWENEITLRSTPCCAMYEPGTLDWPACRRRRCCWWSPADDRLTVADLALAAYERALQPKRLALLPGGHFDAYLGQFPQAEAAATGWFREHLFDPS